jgi:hypothetical protein
MARIWLDLINQCDFHRDFIDMNSEISCSVFAENDVNGMASTSCDDLCVIFVQPACCKLTQLVEVVPLLYNDLRVDL